ncbi:MAG: nucleotide exchange factor GrpE [Candidatus Thorarchaeota archaeon]
MQNKNDSKKDSPNKTETNPSSVEKKNESVNNNGSLTDKPVDNNQEDVDLSSSAEVEEKPEEKTVKKLNLEEIKKLIKDLETVQEDNKVLKDKLLRTHADYQNYRRRIQEDLAKRTEQGKFELFSDLLLTIDNLMVINKNWNPEDTKTIEISRKFLLRLEKELESKGLEKIGTIGQEVDLRYHDVVKSPENGNNDDLIIVAEIQSGYKYKGRVLRPAKVELGKKEIPKEENPTTVEEIEKKTSTSN